MSGFVGQTLTVRSSVPSLAGSLSYPFQYSVWMYFNSRRRNAITGPRREAPCSSPGCGVVPGWGAALWGSGGQLSMGSSVPWPQDGQWASGCTNRGRSGKLKERIIPSYSALIRPCLTVLSFGSPKERHKLEHLQQI